MGSVVVSANKPQKTFIISLCSVLPSRCPQRKTVTAPTQVSLTASTGHPLEAGLRSWMNMDTLYMSLNTHRRRCNPLINHATVL